MGHAEFKKDYTSSLYHGDTSWGGVYGDRPVGIIEVDRYKPDARTVMDDGEHMVVWAHINGACHRVPGFRNGYSRDDALALVKRQSKETS